MSNLLGYAFIAAAVAAPRFLGKKPLPACTSVVQKAVNAGALEAGLDEQMTCDPSKPIPEREGSTGWTDAVKSTMFGAFGASDYDPRLLFGAAGAAPDAAKDALTSTFKALLIPAAIAIGGYLVVRKISS